MYQGGLRRGVKADAGACKTRVGAGLALLAYSTGAEILQATVCSMRPSVRSRWPASRVEHLARAVAAVVLCVAILSAPGWLEGRIVLPKAMQFGSVWSPATIRHWQPVGAMRLISSSTTRARRTTGHVAVPA
ncbi:uncharacterized protein CC84DRAFT_178322 [Paraphaeosphaeria sporulosa]|uniref:Uncharacterized protein n=1 Tax=Paraphaeosphaeria sporulosa TaxID=1460663 RepID=A0A177D0U6_9PLEO|nr:uncharacterized protein CC84DRAFT_178322 [Paraphaeosphaeria sporulosa]OAG13028.1 hypothetical protein CC84DRAFT_178322 [Paraphaeosphaeria sporulosa]